MPNINLVSLQHTRRNQNNPHGKVLNNCGGSRPQLLLNNNDSYRKFSCYRTGVNPGLPMTLSSVSSSVLTIDSDQPASVGENGQGGRGKLQLKPLMIALVAISCLQYPSAEAMPYKSNDINTSLIPPDNNQFNRPPRAANYVFISNKRLPVYNFGLGK
ncbi:hypothetical protein [Biostraticola tofi]|uniref:Uncharacterized protein n=1 Tax=Biostraticola tofi TaxID=466109 RepID=A0A4R3Z0Z5_9GAMM|nr:hypothetical protein [Biostraticola tofi]TCV98726.1 hypothetical protein EDC52_10245 [Biostraticola tofi]